MRLNGSVNRLLPFFLPAFLLPSAASALLQYDLSTMGGHFEISSTIGEPILLVQSDATATTNTVTVKSGVSAELYISSLNISNASRCAISVEPGAELVLHPEGTNRLASGTGAGIHAPAVDGEAASLVLAEGRFPGGLLVVNGGTGAAGIGGNALQAGGAIRVEGGDIRVFAGSGAGIGGGRAGDGGSFAMTGGSVVAQGKAASAGIGGGGRAGGKGGSGGTVEISGGTLAAYGADSAAGIGGGNNAPGGAVSVSGGVVRAFGGAGAAGIGGGAGAGGDGGDVVVSGGWTYTEGDVQSPSPSILAVAGAAAVGGGSAGDGGTITVTGGSLLGEPLGVFGTNVWTAGFVSNGGENGGREVFPVPLAALPGGAAVDLGTYVYAYAGEGGENAVCFHLPAGTHALCADATGETQYARISVSESGKVAVAAGPVISLAWEDGEPVLSFSGGWPGLDWVWQATTNLLDKSSWGDPALLPDAAPRVFWRLRAAE
jgi:hypothetical protein